jgi:hypothetical protein
MGKSVAIGIERGGGGSAEDLMRAKGKKKQKQAWSKKERKKKKKRVRFDTSAPTQGECQYGRSTKRPK